MDSHFMRPFIIYKDSPFPVQNNNGISYYVNFGSYWIRIKPICSNSDQTNLLTGNPYQHIYSPLLLRCFPLAILLLHSSDHKQEIKLVQFLIELKRDGNECDMVQ